MVKLTFLLICGLIPCLLAQCNTVKNAKSWFARSVYDFSVDLISRTAQENDNHFITSTLSSWTLLAYISLGATDRTKAEMKAVLKLHNSKCYNYKYLEIANMIRSNSSSEVVLEKISRIFVSDHLSILDGFKTSLSEAGLSQIESLSFEDSKLAAQIVNSDTSRATHHTINEIVTSEDFGESLMIIIDAIYFKGTWRTPFFNETKVSPFYNDQGEQIGDVNLMYLSSNFNFTFLDDIYAKVLELPYGDSDKYSMLFFLPYDEIPLSTVVENLGNFTLKALYKFFDKSDEQEVVVQLPRFKIASNFKNLKDMLTDLGLTSMFDRSSAKFPFISDHPLFVSNFIQKAVIEVTEKGTVASAVTKAEFDLRTYSQEFVANKPFLFMIVEKQVKVPIFIGAYSKPDLY